VKSRSAGPHPLWDLPTRIFHWLIVCLLPLAWWSAHEGYYEVHQWTGYTVLVLVTTRIVWGFLGSRHSRFRDFLVGPTAVLSYLRRSVSGSAGHNPLGGWSVVVLLALLLAQAISGLFNSDDVLFSGPLYYWAGSELRAIMGGTHELAFNALLAFVGLHIAAVVYHQWQLHEPLLQAMLRGSATGREGREAPVGWWWALLIAGVIGLLLWWGLAQAPRPTLLYG
jgi:cytochrome b